MIELEQKLKIEMDDKKKQIVEIQEFKENIVLVKKNVVESNKVKHDDSKAVNKINLILIST